MKKGFLVIEVLLAAALFVTFATGAIIAVVSSWDTNRRAQEQTSAMGYLSEGLEAARSIRNQDFTKLTDGVKGIARQAAGVWDFSGTSNTTDSGRYTREILVTPVQRNAGGDIVLSGGTPDPNTKQMTSSVTWDFTAARPQDLAVSTYMTNWRATIAAGGPLPVMVYSKTTSVPFYRTWSGSAWSGEGSAGTVGGNINFVKLEMSGTRNEVVLGTLDANGNIYAQVWNGSSWGTPTLMANVGSINATTRSFDIAYEKSGDRAVFAYLPNSTSADFDYRVWDGASWSGATTVTAPPTTGLVKWIDMTQNPVATSNEIALVMIDANIDVYGMAWNGTAWGTMGDAAAWDITASIATKKSIDVAYEQTSGRAVFMWGDSVATDQYYRIWNGTSLTAATLLDIAAAAGVVHWMELVPRPGSNELMYGEVDAAADLNTRKWSGSAWDTATQHAEHSGAVENITSMVFDLVWETHSVNPGKAWLTWGNGTAVSKKQWSGTAWGSATTLTGSDDTSFVKLKAVSGSGEVLAGIYESAASALDDIWESNLTGGGTTWSAKNIIWGGPISAEPVYFRVDIAAR